ncbi:hypothetical protein J7U46_22180 [Pelomonas sp. V22]|uniref:hypothetical protein n=1 Tax=Pelomonas sp. V22 TaxID=2822139 RepID=UPI0024A9C623|nr:hypothetical protein [Pelomonas sp. V22]MDI4635790.1 hypothetical protein [Pelomonas sp. V22]
MKATLPLALAAAALLAGCEVLYDMGQQTALRDCEQMQDASARTECRRRNSQDYRDYEKQRRQLQLPSAASGAQR